MPSPTLVLDTVENAQIQDATDGIRILRTGFIRDIDTSVPDDEIFAQAVGVAGMPNYLDPYPHPTYALALMRRRVVDTIPGVNNRVKLSLYYDSGGPARPSPSTFILSRSTTLVEVSTELTPVGKVPIIITSTPNASFPNIKITPHVASVRYLAPFQRLVATGYYIGTPPATMITALGTVNDAAWHGFPKGYWLFAAQDDRSQDKGLSYNIQLEFWNQMRKDWSEYAIFRDPHGLFLPPKASDTAALQDRAYIRGIYNLDRIVKVGLYDTSSFGTIFGF